MASFAHWLQHIDRRWIYLVLATVLVVSLVNKKPVDPIVLDSVHDLYNAVDHAPAGADDGKLILLDLTFSANTMPENGNQARALMRHLMLRHKRFAILAGDQMGAQIGADMATELAKEYDYVYGEDWISFGYQMLSLSFFTSFPRDIPRTVKNDAIQKQPIASFPIMRGIKTIRDVSLLVEDTAGAAVLYWIADVQGKFPLKIGYTCTGVMAAEAYPFLDSGQLVGMAPGMKGAADYEKLVDALERDEIRAGRRSKPYDPHSMKSVAITSARELMYTQGAAHIVIILFILLGNVGYFLGRRKPRAAKEVAS